MALREYQRDSRHAAEVRGRLRQARAGLPLLLARAAQRRRLVADVGAPERTVLLMVMVMLLVMPARCWT